jgi:D-alanyl-D-alanine carboxypeptidase
MLKFLSLLLSFITSTFSLFNIVDLPQDENFDTDKEIVVTTEPLDIKESHIEDLTPKEVVLSAPKATVPTTGNWWSYPNDIKESTRSGNDLLVLVNKEYRLPSTYAPGDLSIVGENVIRRGSNYYLRSIVLNDLKNLVDTARDQGIDLSIVSAYRSYSTQLSTYNYWVKYNGGCIDCADRISARAGHSQHQLGTTLDFSSSEIGDGLGGQFSNTKASNWLKGNAYKYGFVIGYPQGYESTTGYSYESWHYRYIGKSNALEQHSSGMILEMYLRSKN